MGSLSHYSQGFMHPRWISSINSINPLPEIFMWLFSIPWRIRNLTINWDASSCWLGVARILPSKVGIPIPTGSIYILCWYIYLHLAMVNVGRYPINGFHPMNSWPVNLLTSLWPPKRSPRKKKNWTISETFQSYLRGEKGGLSKKMRRMPVMSKGGVIQLPLNVWVIFRVIAPAFRSKFPKPTWFFFCRVEQKNRARRSPIPPTWRIIPFSKF